MSREGIHNWWGTAWVEKLERLTEPRRFAEGEKLTRSRGVPAISFEGRTVAARVLAPGEPPRTVRISVDPFSPEQWNLLFAEVRDRGELARQLAAGDLPFEINTAYSKARLRFMPERYVDLHLECPCPDWLKPCKHIVALWMQFARSFDRDPFLVFELRGLKRDELLAVLRKKPSQAAAERELEPEEALPEVSVPVRLEGLPSDPAVFWSAPALPGETVESSERVVPDDDIFEKLRDWPELELQFSQIYDAVYELATRIRR